MYTMQTCKLFCPITTIYKILLGVKRFFLIFLLFFYILYIKEINIYINNYISISYRVCTNRLLYIFCTQSIHKSVRMSKSTQNEYKKKTWPSQVY
jgi:hypothetical protein